MAGVKGRSGGPRKNSGGRRPGAGRKPKKRSRQPTTEMTPAQEAALGASLPKGPNAPPEPPEPPEPTEPARAVGITDSKAFLEAVMSGRVTADEAQLKAAQYLLPFQHRKLGETGKKAAANEEAGKVASRFAAAPPRQVAGRKTVN